MANVNDEVYAEGDRLLAEARRAPGDTFDYNALLSVFFRGFPVSRLRDLFAIDDERASLGALFIAEELDARAAPLRADIEQQVNSTNEEIRYSAYLALDSISSADESTFYNVVLGIDEPDKKCRKLAMLLMIRASTSRLHAALQFLERSEKHQEVRNGLRRLLDAACADPANVHAWLLDCDALHRRFGIVAAGRMAEFAPEPFEAALASSDDEVRAVAAVHREFLNILARHRVK